MNKLLISDVNIAGKRVLIRADFNVPMLDDRVLDCTRIDATLPTVRYALSNGACVILMSHLGRPGGMPNPRYSLRPLTGLIEQKLGTSVRFLPYLVGPDLERSCSTLVPGDVVLLENLRFNAEEEGLGCSQKAIAEFQSSLSRLGDVYVNDAFGAAHRNHASVVGMRVPQRVAGLLMQKEIEYFERLLSQDDRPFLAILGGGPKVADKAQSIEQLLNRSNAIIVCGGMAFTFKKASSEMTIGDSRYDEGSIALVRRLLTKSKLCGVPILQPIDYVVADRFSNFANTYVTNDTSGIKSGWQGLDCGPKSIDLFREIIGRAKIIFWNGSPGVFELERFSSGTRAMAEAIALATANGATTIVAGGDTIFAARTYGISEKVSHLSTGGGAALSLLEGRSLPGVSALSEREPT